MSTLDLKDGHAGRSLHGRRRSCALRRALWHDSFALISTMPSPPFLAPGRHAPAAALSKTQLPTAG
jgi:hypothetical protein